MTLADLITRHQFRIAMGLAKLAIAKDKAVAAIKKYSKPLAIGTVVAVGTLLSAMGVEALYTGSTLVEVAQNVDHALAYNTLATTTGGGTYAGLIRGR